MNRLPVFFLSTVLLYYLSCDVDLPVSENTLTLIDSDWVKEELPPTGSNWALFDLEFTNPANGWAVGSVGYDIDYPERGIILKYDGSSWTNAYKYLQDALADANVSGDDIWVAAGTYEPDTNSSSPGGTGSAI